MDRSQLVGPSPLLEGDGGDASGRDPAGLLRLVVSPSREADGRRAIGQRGPFWDVRLEGETALLCERVVTPFCEGARALLARSPELAAARVTMRHAGAACDSFKPVRLDAAAALTVEEGAAGLRFARFKPHPGRNALRSASQDGE